MVKLTISTTIESSLWRRGKDKNIKMSDALSLGLLKLLDEPIMLDNGATISSPNALAMVDKISKANLTLQAHIMELNSKIEVLENGDIQEE